MSLSVSKESIEAWNTACAVRRCPLEASEELGAAAQALYASAPRWVRGIYPKSLITTWVEDRRLYAPEAAGKQLDSHLAQHLSSLGRWTPAVGSGASAPEPGADGGGVASGVKQKPEGEWDQHYRQAKALWWKEANQSVDKMQKRWFSAVAWCVKEDLLAEGVVRYKTIEKENGEKKSDLVPNDEDHITEHVGSEPSDDPRTVLPALQLAAPGDVDSAVLADLKAMLDKASAFPQGARSWQEAAPHIREVVLYLTLEDPSVLYAQGCKPESGKGQKEFTWRQVSRVLKISDEARMQLQQHWRDLLKGCLQSGSRGPERRVHTPVFFNELQALIRQRIEAQKPGFFAAFSEQIFRTKTPSIGNHE